MKKIECPNLDKFEKLTVEDKHTLVKDSWGPLERALRSPDDFRLEVVYNTGNDDYTLVFWDKKDEWCYSGFQVGNHPPIKIKLEFDINNAHGGHIKRGSCNEIPTNTHNETTFT